jgi:hypothetical protein
MSAGTLRVHDTLRDALAVEMREFFNQMHVL